jgi:hypothetical protein
LSVLVLVAKRFLVVVACESLNRAHQRRGREMEAEPAFKPEQEIEKRSTGFCPVYSKWGYQGIKSLL